jgi:transcriptional regulator with XRE-family HTH domain
MDKINIDIKQIRENQRLTQTEFSEILGVSRSTIVKIEGGEVKLSKKMIEKLQNSFPKELGLPYDDSSFIMGIDNDSDVLLSIISTNLGCIDMAKQLIKIMVNESEYTFEEHLHFYKFLSTCKRVDFEKYNSIYHSKSNKYEYRFLIDFLNISKECLFSIYEDLFSFNVSKYHKKLSN